MNEQVKSLSIKIFSIMKLRFYKTLVHLETEPLYKTYCPSSWVLFVQWSFVYVSRNRNIKKIRGIFLYFYYRFIQISLMNKGKRFSVHDSSIPVEKKKTVQIYVGIGASDLVRVRKLVLRNFRCQCINMAEVYFSVVSLPDVSWATLLGDSSSTVFRNSNRFPLSYTDGKDSHSLYLTN